MRAEIHTRVHTDCPLLLSDFNPEYIISDCFQYSPASKIMNIRLSVLKLLHMNIYSHVRTW
jgi:hypothetical protein